MGVLALAVAVLTIVDVFLPLRIRHGDGDLNFFSTVSAFGMPLDITVAELAGESFFPADPRTASVLRNGHAQE